MPDATVLRKTLTLDMLSSVLDMDIVAVGSRSFIFENLGAGEFARYVLSFDS